MVDRKYMYTFGINVTFLNAMDIACQYTELTKLPLPLFSQNLLTYVYEESICQRWIFYASPKFTVVEQQQESSLNFSSESW